VSGLGCCELVTDKGEGLGRGREGGDEVAASVELANSMDAVPWRLRSRSKTLNAGMFICLNIGVDPPDIVKTNPCAKLECWLDPTALPSTKAIEAIGRSEWFRPTVTTSRWTHRTPCIVGMP
jgi:hypothetical protein